MVWNPHQFPELSNVPRRAREIVLHECLGKSLPAGMALQLGLTIAGGLVVIGAFLSAAGGMQGSPIGAAGLMLTIVAVCLVVYRVWLQGFRREVARYMRSRAEDGRLTICVSCGNELPESLPEHCPTCGLRVYRPKHNPWL